MKLVLLYRLNRWLEASPTRSVLAGTALSVVWFGGWVVRGAVRFTREALAA